MAHGAHNFREQKDLQGLIHELREERQRVGEQVTGIDRRIAALDSSVSTNTSDIATNTSDIAALETDLDGFEGQAHTWTADQTIGDGSQLLADGGSAAAPGIAWAADSNTGIFQPGDNDGTVRIATHGGERFRFDHNGDITFQENQPRLVSGGSYFVVPNGCYFSGSSIPVYVESSFRPRNNIYNDGGTTLYLDGGTDGRTTIRDGSGGVNIALFDKTGNDRNCRTDIGLWYSYSTGGGNPASTWIGVSTRYGDLGSAYGSNTYPVLKTPYAALYFSVNGNFASWMDGAGGMHPQSDASLKRDFARPDPRDVLDRFRRVPVQTFKFKGDGSRKLHIGVTAQDFFGEFPELMVPEPEEGEERRPEHENKQLGYNERIGVLMAAVQALADRVDELETSARRNA